MRLLIDTVHEYFGFHVSGGVCRIRIYEEEGKPYIIVCTELPENGNTSITNMAEYLAGEVFTMLSEPKRGFKWVEHYPKWPNREETFDRVTFQYSAPILNYWPASRKNRPTMGKPQWHHLSREALEEMIGGELL